MFHHKITSETVEINAPSQCVWDILIDFQRYPEWNPFTTSAKGKLALGEPVELQVIMPKRGNRAQTETITTIDAPHQLAWGMKLGFKQLLSARREQILNVIDTQRCTYSTSDAFHGMLSGLVYALFYDDVRNGFNNVAYALRDRAEKQWHQQKAS